ncbi:MAG TPA: serine/threonine-protein kinase, partial [Verrucomicrobiae bacterium]
IALITAALLISVISIGLQWKMFVWWPWLVPVFIQLPLAYAFSFYARRKMKPIAQPVPASGLEIASPLGVTLHSAVTKVTPEQPLVSGTPEIPDHTLLRCVGRGAYGEVWLARDVLGQFHAVKIVYRARFASDGPYEREFKGLQNFTPISRLHPGWVHILHVGRNDKAGYFFCIMEVADDETSGQRFDPATYTPKTLSGMVTKQGRLPLVECVEIGIALTSALEHLHKYSLIHRDIKPSNVIFAHGAPKFADIGLVTEFRSESHDVSFLGTEGYIAPEGPGSPSADIYSLGKLLYEIAMGRDRREFPEPPTTLLEKSESPDWTAFMEILYKACAIQPLSRYASASAMLPGLQKIKCGWDKAPVS